MNERIKELASLAKIQMCSDERLQDFAERIIWTCATIALHAEEFRPDESVAGIILDHFGIEE